MYNLESIHSRVAGKVILDKRTKSMEGKKDYST
jgi:hypothetical protein